MKSFLRRVIANLIIISIILADFLPLGIGLVSLAQEGDAIDYSVRFVEITNNTEPLETEEDSENIEEVPVLEGTSSNVYYKEDFSLLGVTDSKDVAQDEETQIEDIKDEVITNNEENLPDGPAIEIRIKVNSKGYLKNGKVEIKNYESQMFSIRDDAKKDINIYSITDNKIKLNQINNNQEFIAYVPISIKDEKAIDMENLHAGTTFAFMATYVGENGYEQIVSMNENAILNINNDYPINMNCFVEKYIPFVEEENKKAIVQIKLIGGMVGNQVLPAKNTSYEVFLPTIEGVEIQDVNVFAVSTAYTNSLVDSSVQFSVENWEFSYGKITINVENNPQDGLYYKSVGNDEFIISFIYSGELDGKEELLSSKATMKAEIYSSDGMIEKAYQEDYSLNLLEANKSIITYEVSGKTKEISKGYLIGNLNREVEDRAVEYENTLNVNISRVELLKTIHISETKEYFEDEMGNQYPTLRNDNADSFYKEIKVNKTNLENILGDKGSLELRNRENTLITINKETPDDGDGFIRVAFGDNVIDTLEFVINAPEADGILNITAVKNIFKPTYNKLDIKNFKAIVAEYSATATLDLDTETNMGSTNVVTFLKDTMTDFGAARVRKVTEIKKDKLALGSQGFKYISIEPSYLVGMSIRMKYKIRIFNNSDIDYTSYTLQKMETPEEIYEAALKLEQSNEFLSGKHKVYGNVLGLYYYTGEIAMPDEGEIDQEEFAEEVAVMLETQSEAKNEPEKNISTIKKEQQDLYNYDKYVPDYLVTTKIQEVADYVDTSLSPEKLSTVTETKNRAWRDSTEEELKYKVSAFAYTKDADEEAYTKTKENLKDFRGRTLITTGKNNLQVSVSEKMDNQIKDISIKQLPKDKVGAYTTKKQDDKNNLTKVSNDDKKYKLYTLVNNSLREESEKTIYNDTLVVDLIPIKAEGLTYKPTDSETDMGVIYIDVVVQATQSNIDDMSYNNLAEILVYSNSVGRRDMETIPGNAYTLGKEAYPYEVGFNRYVDPDLDEGKAEKTFIRLAEDYTQETTFDFYRRADTIHVSLERDQYAARDTITFSEPTGLALSRLIMKNIMTFAGIIAMIGITIVTSIAVTRKGRTVKKKVK